MSLEQGTKTIHHPNHKLKDVEQISISECQMNPKSLNRKFHGWEVSCYRNKNWGNWDRARVAWTLEEFK